MTDEQKELILQLAILFMNRKNINPDLRDKISVLIDTADNAIQEEGIYLDYSENAARVTCARYTQYLYNNVSGAEKTEMPRDIRHALNNLKFSGKVKSA